jgi:hypothetical protein
MPKTGLAGPGPLLQCLQKRKLSQERQQQKQAPSHKRPAPSCEKQVSGSVHAQKPKASIREEVVRVEPKAIEKHNSLPKAKKPRKESFDNTASQQPPVSSQSDPFIDAEDREIARLEKLLGISKGTRISPRSALFHYFSLYSIPSSVSSVICFLHCNCNCSEQERSPKECSEAQQRVLHV